MVQLTISRPLLPRSRESSETKTPFLLKRKVVVKTLLIPLVSEFKGLKLRLF